MSFPMLWPTKRAKWLLERQSRVPRASDGVVTAFRDGQVTLRANRRIDGFTEAVQEIGYQGIRNGDLVVHSMDGFAGAIGISDSDGKASPVVHAYKVTADVDARFIAYFLRTMAKSGYIESLAKGIRERSTAFDAATLANLQLPCPTLAEQRRIADFLDAETARIDQLTAIRRAQIASLGELWDSRLAVAISEQARIYGWIPLRRLVTSVEQGWSPQCDDAIAEADQWAVLKTSAVSSGEFLATEHKRLPADIEPDLRYQVRDGDILLTRGSGSPDHVGIPALAKTGGRRLLLSDLLYRIRLESEWSPEFVILALRSRPVRGLTGLLFRGQSGQTIKLRGEDIRSIEIPAVPAGLQAVIAVALAAEQATIRRACQSIEASLSLLAERRQALITAAVTGEITV